MMDKKYQVAILGSGIGGTTLACILARQGLSVVVIEKFGHPRFAIGESTIPETTFMFRFLAQRYDVPELENLSNFRTVHNQVSSSCGIKRNFSFFHHVRDQPFNPKHSTQFPTWAPPFGPDIHFYRQDVDAYLLATAVKYGVEVKQYTTISDIEIDENQGVSLVSDKGEVFYSDYVVDAGGMQSPLATLFDLREQPPSYKTQSRGLFTHMVGVKHFDDCLPGVKDHGLPSPACQGTLHHIFDYFLKVPV